MNEIRKPSDSECYTIVRSLYILPKQEEEGEGFSDSTSGNRSRPTGVNLETAIGNLSPTIILLYNADSSVRMTQVLKDVVPWHKHFL
jgi:hypothetical protein